MTEPPIRVLLVDDDDLMRAGLKAVLSSDETVEVVGEAGNGRAALERVRTLRPDLVLMDVRMPDLDGIAATREVLAGSPDVKVVILTTFEQDDYIFGALHARPRASCSNEPARKSSLLRSRRSPPETRSSHPPSRARSSSTWRISRRPRSSRAACWTS